MSHLTSLCEILEWQVRLGLTYCPPQSNEFFFLLIICAVLVANMEFHNTCKIGAKIGLASSIGKDAGTQESCIAKLDAFGDETNAGPKTKPMAWW